MSREDIVAIASRLFALFLVVLGFRSLAALVKFAGSPDSTTALIAFVVVVALVPLVIAALLWFFPLTVARKLLPVMRTPAPSLSIGGDVMPVALTVMGLWVLATSLSDFVYWLTLLLYASHSTIPVEFPPEQKARIASTVIELGIGIWLVFGAKGLGSLLLRLRYAGQPTGSGVP